MRFYSDRGKKVNMLKVLEIEVIEYNFIKKIELKIEEKVKIRYSNILQLKRTKLIYDINDTFIEINIPDINKYINFFE